MKFSTLLTIAISGFAAVEAHTIFQKVSVNGVDQGQLKGVRAPDSDYPIENVNDSQFACNKDIRHKDNTIINVPAGARVGAWWGHVIGGKQSPNDPDHPIAASHKGPIIVYLAKVDNAATTGTTGLKWFKISEEGLNTSTGKWAVDNMIANDGWNYFTMPTCIAPGNYLMRVELIALHNAYSANGAQFYMECAQINVTGTGTNTGSNTVSFPGAYQSNHPGIQISIYGTAGVPNNGGKAYQIPGPPVLQCSGSDNGSGNGGQTPTEPTQPTQPTAQPSQPAAGTVAKYGQCGGNGYTGPVGCVSGSTCSKINDWYSQCI
ncbi:hypothetical protein BJ508DRAFT_204354 [Ascobolus immersus RN42]|uniref:AA9 family lytic polysaccharide monooxygenase n=1 Tax=Ascobolus immersus RN42 TaxID=1160509 RepID=A0A3N4INS9_ASCIM|nr:hypothetical protein BJ508DRAFT_204354 [Ascobolus immersus RN42]